MKNLFTSRRRLLIKQLEGLDPEELQKRKTITDLVNAGDYELSFPERILKKRIIPIFLPFVTIMVTVFIWSFTNRENAKSKALDRYKSEVELVKLVWEDVKKREIDSPAYTSAIRFLTNMYKANEDYYRKDSSVIGVGTQLRPIMILARLNPMLRDSINAISNFRKANRAVKKAAAKESDKTEISDPLVKNVYEPVVNKKDSTVVKAIDAIAPDKLKVYLMYSTRQNKGLADNLAKQLGDSYVVPPLDFVENQSGYNNEIRYYSEADMSRAKELAQRIKNITGLDFQLRNINVPSIHNTIEVWYNNIPKEVAPSFASKIVETPVSGYVKVYEGNHYTARGYQSVITPELEISVMDYNSDTQEAELKLNDNKTIEVVKKGTVRTFEVDGMKVHIEVNDYKRNATFRKVLMYKVVIEKPIEKKK